MITYLVDYENNKNLTGMDKLTEKDTVVLFYSKNASTLSFESHFNILNCKAKIEYRCVNVGGNNALDFQLSSYLGYLLSQNPKSQYCILAKDRGYSHVISFWKRELNADIQLVSTLGKAHVAEAPEESHAPATEQVQTKQPNKNELIIEELKKTEIQMTEEEVSATAKIVCKYKTKKHINANLMKLFKQGEKVKVILKTLKPFLTDKK